MHAVLIHGMGRTPAAMLILAARLRRAGFRPCLFGYTATFERWESCVARLERFIRKRVGTKPYIVVAHSLGTVLTRAVVPHLATKPTACFFLAPPTVACRAARRLATRFWYRWFTGDMGQRLADASFMAALPAPVVPTKIYAGASGPIGRWSPFGDVPNDGILGVDETTLPGVPRDVVPSLHTFIMNASAIAKDIVEIAELLAAARASESS